MKSLSLAFALSLSAAPAQPPADIPEAPSTVAARYVEPSAARVLQPGEKIARLYNRNVRQSHVLQKLAANTYWVQKQFYAATFYVGKSGVLLFDAPENRAEGILEAIKEVTPLPVTALVYSHAHFDHIGGAPVIAEAAKRANYTLRVIASKATEQKLAYAGSKLPKPNDPVAWPGGSFFFENLKVQLHGFKRAAHTDDHAVWLLVEEKVLHAPDHLNPDQLPFWNFGGSENFVYYEGNLKETEKLDWTFVNGGHGNVGSREDYRFYHVFIGDLKGAVGKAMQAVPWGAGVDPAKANTHAAYLVSWFDAVAKQAVGELRPKYGKYYGYEYSTPANAQMVAQALGGYR